MGCVYVILHSPRCGFFASQMKNPGWQRLCHPGSGSKDPSDPSVLFLFYFFYFLASSSMNAFM